VNRPQGSASEYGVLRWSHGRHDVTPDNTRWPQEGLDERPAQLGHITRPEVIQALFETAEALRRVHPVGGDMRIVYAPTLTGLLIVVTPVRPDRDHKWRIFAAHTMGPKDQAFWTEER
jgi:hypothetical protein